MNILTTSIQSILILLILTSFSSLSFEILPAQSVELKTDSIKTVVISTHYTPPWSYKDCSGAEIDIIRLAFKQVGLTIECSYSSYARLVQNFMERKTQFASPIVKTDGDSVSAIYSDNFIPYVDVVASFEEKQITIKDLHRKTFVAYQNAQKYLGPNYAYATKKARYYKELPGRDEQIRMLARGRIDYVIGEKNILITLAKRLYPNRKLHVNLVLKHWDIRAGAHNPELMQQFNKGLRAIKQQGKVKEIFSQYEVVIPKSHSVH